MQQYREAIVREILFILIPSILLLIIAIIGIVILVKFTETWKLKHARIFIFSTTFIILIVCGLILFFDTKDLFYDLNNNNFIEYFGEATFDEEQSNKDFNCFRLNDNEKTIVVSNVGKVEATIDKCIVHVVYGGNSKFVIVFEVEEVLEERLPINFH